MANQNVGLWVNVGMRDQATAELKRFESSVIRTVGAITAAFATLKTVLFPITQAAQFERAMADVAKTTGYTDKEIGRLSGSLVEMSTRLGVSAMELANISAIAGQLGLGQEGRKAVEAFTESVAKASVTLGLTAEEAANAGATISSIFGTSIQDVERIFATINELSNNSVAAGSDLVDIMKRVGTASGATLQEVAALAATMRQVGVPNEQAGTALVKFLGNLLAESEKFANAMGKTQSEWVTQVQANAVDALKDVLQTLSQMEAAEAAALTKELFGSGRLYSAASKLIQDAANDFGVLDKMLGIATEGFDEGTSSLTEYERIMQTVVEQTEVLKGSFNALGVEVGKQVLPVILNALKEFSALLRDDEVVAYFNKLGKGFSNLIKSLIDAAKWVANLNIEWTNVGVAIKLLLQFKLAKVIIGWGISLTGLFGIVSKLNLGLVALFGTLRTIGSVGVLSLGGLASGLTGVLGLFARVNSFAALTTAAVAALKVVFSGLATGLTALLGPGGLIVALLATTIYHWWDEITTFLGFVDKKDAERQRLADERQREFEEAKDRAIADAEEYVSQIDRLFNDAGEVKAAKTREINYRINLDVEQSIQDARELFQELTRIQQAQASFGVGTKAVGINLRDVGSKIAETEAVIASYRAELDKISKQYGGTNNPQQYTGFPTEKVAEFNAKIEESSVVLAKLKAQQAAFNQQLDQFKSSAEASKKAAEEVYNPLVADIIDAQLAGYVKLRGEITATESAMATLTKTRDELNKKLLSDEQVSPVDIENLNKATNEIAQLEERLKTLRPLMKEIDDPSTLSQFQQGVKKAIDSLSTDSLKDFADALDGIGIDGADQTTRLLRENANAAIYNYLKLKDLKEAYDLVGGAAVAYAKTAQSVFDNTNNEIIALQRNLAEFATDFKNRFSSLKIDIKLSDELDEIDEDYEAKKKEIEDFYNARIQIADTATKRYLENKKKEALADLEHDKVREEADAKAASYREQYNLVVERTKRLMEEANKEAAKGNVDKALSLKELSKSGLDDLQDLLGSMQELSTVNVLGETEFKFSEDELLRLLDDMEGVGREVGGDIIDANKSLRDATEDTADKWKAAMGQVGVEFAKAEAVVDKMKATFSNFDEVMKDAEAGFKASAEDWKSTIEAFNLKVLDNPFAALEIGPQFATELKTTIEKSTREGFLGAASGINIQVPVDAVSSFDPVRIGRALQQAGEIGFENFDVYMGNKLTQALESKQDDIDLNFNVSGIGQRIQEAVDNNPVEAVIEGTFDEEKLKNQIKNLDATMDRLTVDELEVKKVTGAVSGGGFARGGYIRGAGTATSDSIPAWLSNGEYVIDAFTTRFFGSGFFAGLQSLARGGRRARMPRDLPGFASGGAVSGGSSVGSITLNIGNRAFTLYGERQQAKDLVGIFKNLDRG